MTRRRGQHHPGDLRRALLDAALGLVAEGTEPGLRAVARAAGVSPGAPYHHFAHKQALLAAVAAEGFANLDAALAAHAGRAPEDRLRSMAADYVRFAVAHAAHYRVMFTPELRSFGDENLEAAARATFGRLVAAMAAVGGPEHALRRALRGWGLAHGLVALHLDGLVGDLDPDLDTEALARDVGVACLALATTEISARTG